jgi:DNA topoisomerase-3
MTGILFEKLYIAEKPAVAKAIAEALVDFSKRSGNERGDRIETIREKSGATYMVVGRIGIVPFFGHMLEQAYPPEYNPAFKSFTGSAHLLPCIPPAWIKLPVKKSEAQLKLAQRLVRQSKVIVNAGDPDPEGMLLVHEALEFFGAKQPIKRVLPTATDPKTIKKALLAEEDNESHLSIYWRALARQRADWLVGINMCRACTSANQLGEKLTVGRVQSVVLAMIVARELEIRNFVPEDYFEPTAVFQHPNGSYRGRWAPAEGQNGLNKDGRLTDCNVAKSVLANISGAQGIIEEYAVTQEAQAAPLPFTLAEIQRKANSLFGLSAKQVLTICQSLYETHKVASYPRTDSNFLKEDQHGEAPDVLSAISQFDPRIAALSSKADPTVRSKAWNDKKSTPHHGIIPTSYVNYDNLSEDERKVFTLIVRNYLAQFYPDYTYEQTTVVTSCGGHVFRTSGRTPIAPGWKTVFAEEPQADPEGSDEPDAEQDVTLPKMHQGDAVSCKQESAEKKTTKKPRRYTESSMLHAMCNISELVQDPAMKAKLKECKGIGTPATQADIIEKNKKVGFIYLEKKHLVPTDGAIEFVGCLPPEITDPVLTARWEFAQEKIQNNELTLERFMTGIESWVTEITIKAVNTPISIALDRSVPAETLVAAGAGSTCSACEKGKMLPRKAKAGPNAGKYFLGCNQYPDCTNTVQVNGQEAASGRASMSGKSNSSARKSGGTSWGTRSEKPTTAANKTSGKVATAGGARSATAPQIAPGTGLRRGFASFNNKSTK